MALKIETDEDFRNFIELSHQVLEMTRHPGWAMLVDYWKKTIADAELDVLRGRCSTVEEYQRTTGKFSGIHLVLDTPQDLEAALGRERERRAEESS